MAEPDLSTRERAVLAIARGLTTDAAGTEAGISGRTVRRWREDPSFAADVDTARRAILAEASAALGAAARDAVSVLHAALADDSPTIRVRAAVALLNALPSIAEHVELAARISDLEARLTEGTDTWPAAT